MNTDRIGILDSGTGGLSILREVRMLLPLESYVYIGDHQYMPYGSKTKEQIQKRVISLIQFLLHEHCKMILIACNTATVAGIDMYREQFPRIPIIGVVPVIKTASQISKTKKILLLSTVFTMKSVYQKKLIQSFAADCEIWQKGSSLLVEFIENGQIGSQQTQEELVRMLEPMNTNDIDTIVLGCTHFPFLSALIHELVPRPITLLDSGQAVARQVNRVLVEKNILTPQGGKGEVRYITTGKADHVETIFRHILDDAHIVVEKSTIF